MVCKQSPAVVNDCVASSHVTTFQGFGSLFTFTTGCQVPYNHVITTCNLLCQLPQKDNEELAGKVASGGDGEFEVCYLGVQQSFPLPSAGKENYHVWWRNGPQIW